MVDAQKGLREGEQRLTEERIKEAEIKYSISLQNLANELIDKIGLLNEYPNWYETGLNDNDLLDLIRKLISESVLKTAPKEDYTTAERKKRYLYARKFLTIIMNSPYYQDIVSIIDDLENKKESSDDPERVEALIQEYESQLSFFESWVAPIKDGAGKGSK